MSRSYHQFFALTKGSPVSKEEIVSAFTQGRTDSLRALTDFEYLELLRSLSKDAPKRPFTPKAGDPQRKKIIAIAKQMGWDKHRFEGYKHDLMGRIDVWCLKQKFKKVLNQHTEAELNVLVTIFEEKVYRSYLEDLNRGESREARDKKQETRTKMQEARQNQLKDTDPMPFGKHKGTAMANVPDPYLKWLASQLRLQLEQGRSLSPQYQAVLDYIEDFGVENLEG